MAITNTDNQALNLKEKVKKFYKKSEPFLAEGVCPTKEIVASTFDRWSLFCIYNLAYHNVLRFNELKRLVNGISPRMLTVTLKKLEGHGIVNRKLYPEIPPKVEYSLTEFGEELADKSLNLLNWFMENNSSIQEKYLNSNNKTV